MYKDTEINNNRLACSLTFFPSSKITVVLYVAKKIIKQLCYYQSFKFHFLFFFAVTFFCF